MLASALCGGVLAAATTATAAPPVITPQGVGALRLGATVKALQGQNLIGGLRKGCELEPGQRVAPLRAPLSGWAVFEAGQSRLSELTIEGGGAATAKHVAVGSTAAEARAAYPNARYQAPGTADPFAQGFLWVPSIQRPRMTFLIDPDSRLVEAVSIPSPAFCE